MFDAAALELAGFVCAIALVILVPLVVAFGVALRQESRVRAVAERALQRGAARRGVITTCHGMQGQAWVFDVRIEDGAAPRVVRVEQLIPRWVAAGLAPGREALVRLDPEAPQNAVFDLAAMGWSLSS